MKKSLLLFIPFLLFAESSIQYMGKENGLNKNKIICENGNSAVVLINPATRETYLIKNGQKIYYGKNALMKIEKETCR